MITIEPPKKQAAAGGAAFTAVRKTELRRFLVSAAKMVGLEGEVHVLLSDDAALRRLNKFFRKKDKATDVLSFPAAEGGSGVAGDLAISIEMAERQAREHGHSLNDEIRILLLHGLLHLAGYDHEVDQGEMAAEETRLRTALALPVGLIERAGEIVAAEAERASIKYKQVEFMQSMSDKVFDGIISGMIEHGMFVEIIETKCEGMVRLSELTDDFYEVDLDNFRIVGKRQKKIYTLGDTVQVKVKKTDLTRRTIDLELITTKKIAE